MQLRNRECYAFSLEAEMKIIKNGQYKRDIVEFECSNCGCIFRADNTEYVPASQIEAVYDNIIASCTCPWCKKIAYKYYH